MVKTIKAIAAAIYEAGEIPSGHIYAYLMSQMSLDEYNRAISILLKTGLVKQTPGHLLVWQGAEVTA